VARWPLRDKSNSPVLGRYGDPVVFGTYRDLFAAIATTAGALTGLLFVALSVAPRGGPVAGPPVVRQVRAAAALLAFNNALAVSLFGLVPGTNIGYPALALGILGILFTAGAIRSVLSSRSTRNQQLRQLGLIGLLLLIFGTELVAGITVLAEPASSVSRQVIGYALITSLLVGIARAWELVGGRDTGLTASIAALTGRTRAPQAAADQGVGSSPVPDGTPGQKAHEHQPGDPSA
jgi:hypothetical protein